MSLGYLIYEQNESGWIRMLNDFLLQRQHEVKELKQNCKFKR